MTPTSGLFNLNLKDISKGLATAIFAGGALAVLAVAQSVFSAPGFDLFAVDWSAMVHNMINAGVIGAEGGFSGYLIKNFFSDQSGKVFGKIG